MGATFAFTEAAVANQRQRDDPINGAVGACAAGFLAGLRGAYSVVSGAEVNTKFLNSSFITNGSWVMRRNGRRYGHIRLRWFVDRRPEYIERGEKETLLQTAATDSCGLDHIAMYFVIGLQPFIHFQSYLLNPPG